MYWTCQCGSINTDHARFCSRCGNSSEHVRESAPPPPPPLPGPAPSAKPSTGIAGWKLAVVGGVLIFGVLFGTMVAVMVFGRGESHETAQTSPAATPNQDPKSAFQQAFETSFKNSCRQSAMRSGNVSQAVADSYCNCALSVFNQTHSMTKVAGSCAQYVMRPLR